MLRRLLVAAAALQLAGCADDPVGTIDPVVARVELSPSTATLTVGDTLRLTAKALTADGTEVDTSIQWGITDATRADVVSSGSRARVTALRAGSVEVTATAAGHGASAALELMNPLPVSEALEPAIVQAGAGGFVLLVRGAGFTEDAVVKWNGEDRPTTYSSRTELRAQIAASDVSVPGQVTVHIATPAPGGGVSTPLTFTIEAADGAGPVARVALDVDSVALEEGQTRQLVATPLDASGHVVTGRAVQWSISDAQIALVTPDGQVRSVRPGVALVTAKIDGQTASAPVRVWSSHPYDVVYDEFTGRMTELLRLDIREAAGQATRVFQNQRWATDPAASPDGSRIAVVRQDATGARGIWLVGPDGSDIVEVTSGTDDQPAWSPDGGRIAFRRRDPQGRTDLWVLRLSDGVETNLTADLEASSQSSPAWSANGRIAFSHAANGEAHIWTMAPDGSDRRQVTTGAVYDDEPDFSPDGLQIAFQRFGDLWLVQATGGPAQGLVLLPFGQFGPAWSPDGALVAFTSKDAQGVFQVFTVRLDGGAIAQRTFGTAPVGDDALPPHKANPGWLLRR